VTQVTSGSEPDRVAFPVPSEDAGVTAVSSWRMP
jgi:hypothetical protein